MSDMVQASASTQRRHRHALAHSRRVLGSPSRRYFWFPLSLLFGVATWGMYLYLGLHTGRRRYLLLSAGAGVAMLVGLILAGLSNGNNDLAGNLGGVLILTVWLGGIVHALIICAADLDGVRDPVAAAERERNRWREYGRRLLIKQPDFARELGVGRPDLAGSDHCFLVDFNHAPAAALCTVQGISPAIAHQIVEYRDAGGDFSSVHDLVVTLDLSPYLADGLHNAAVFVRP
jgi:Helix-hairpin-helix motif